MKRLKFFILHSLKQFTRNESFATDLVLKVGSIFGGVFLLASCLFFGVFIERIASHGHYAGDMVNLVNNFMIGYLAVAFLYNFILAPDIAMSIKPYLLLPVEKNFICHYFIARFLLMSAINYSLFFLFIPMGINIIMPQSSLLSMLGWLLSIFSFAMTLAIIAIFARKLYQMDWVKFSGMVILILCLISGEYFHIVDLRGLFLAAMNKIINIPLLALFPLVTFLMIYNLFAGFLRGQFYLFEKSNGNHRNRQKSNFSKGKYLKNLIYLDFKLIWRNKNLRKVVFATPALALFYIPFFIKFATLSKNLSVFFVLVFITQIADMFYRSVFDWKADFFDFILIRFSIRKYYKNIFLINVILQVIVYVIVCVGLLFLSLRQWIYPLLAFGMFFVGIYSFWALYLHVKFPSTTNFNENKFATKDLQNTMKRLLLLLPIIIIAILYILAKEELLVFLSISGITGLVFHQQLVNILVSNFKRNKYKMATIYRRNI